MGVLKRLGLVLGVTLLIVAYAIAFIAAMAIAVIGIPFAALAWVATGNYHDPTYCLGLLMDGDPI